MKAAFFSKHGDSSVFDVGEVPSKKLDANEVRVRVEIAALNHVDIWVRQGSPAYPVSLPHVLGADGAGTIEEVGADVEGVSSGDRVLILPALSCGICSYCLSGKDNQCEKFEILGTKRFGTYAEFVTVPDDNVVLLPDNISFDTAAAFPLSYLTAWHMLIGRAKVNAGEKILIIGAGSGVGSASIQIAKARGAKVFAMTTSASKVELIKSIGADEVYLQEGQTNFSKWAQQQTGGHGVDVVVEHVGPATWDESLKSLTKYGRLVTCGATSGPTVSMDLRQIFSRDLTLLGARMGTKKEFQELCNVVFSEKIKPLIDKIFPLEEATNAHAYMDARQQTGKILLKIRA